MKLVLISVVHHIIKLKQLLLRRMPNGLSNWSEKDVTSFLKEHSFQFYELRKGSHYAYINKATGHIVEINIPKDAYIPRTLETMIRQSGISKKEWRDWAGR